MHEVPWYQTALQTDISQVQVLRGRVETDTLLTIGRICLLLSLIQSTVFSL